MASFYTVCVSVNSCFSTPPPVGRWVGITDHDDALLLQLKELRRQRVSACILLIFTSSKTLKVALSHACFRSLCAQTFFDPQAAPRNMSCRSTPFC